MKWRLVLLAALAVLLSSAPGADARWGTGAGAQTVYSDEQVCRNGVTWRYATIRPLEYLDPMTGQPSSTATGTPVPVRLYDVLSSAYAGGPVEQTPAARLTGPDDLAVGVNPIWIDPAEVGFGGLTDYRGLYDYSAIFTFEFQALRPVGGRVRVQWRFAPNQPYSDFFVWPTWPVANCHLIDIAPGEFPNSVNPRVRGEEVAVAVLTTPEFDAGRIDRATARLRSGGHRAGARSSRRYDSDSDGDRDVVLRFATRRAGIRCGTLAARLTARLRDGTRIRGSDTVEPVGC